MPEVIKTDGRGILAGDYLNQNRPITRQDWLEDCFPEWGSMLSDGKQYMQTAPWMLIYPGLVILVCVIIFNLLGDILRDVLDPRGKTIKRRTGMIFRRSPERKRGYS